jgi:hypothetical protein
MFWWRKKQAAAPKVSSVQAYAAQLGVERRRQARILYPHHNLNLLPSVFFGTRSLRVHDLSVGGACLIDKEDFMGPNAGHDLELRLIWPECERVVRCRMVSRVDTRRHIQFLDLEGERVEAINSAINPGVLGQSMRITQLTSREPRLEARELWTSVNGDALSFADDVHVIAELTFAGQTFRLLKEAWPLDSGNQPASPRDVERMLIFLFNFPRPSESVNTLKQQLQSFYFEGRA